MMAGKPKSMSQIKQLLQLHKQGKAKKEIARILGVSKNTVKSYLQKVEANQLDIGQLIELENPILEAKFHAGNPSYKEERYEHFKANVDYYLKELQRTGVTKHLLWEEYKSGYPDGYSHTQFCYHLNQQKVAARPSAILQHTPGDKLYIDFA
uniref:helix-turn-helix domain-containing protein n=1 Tax=Carboxylicivirga longa TaxID=3134029 RepID=UPI003D352F11